MLFIATVSSLILIGIIARYSFIQPYIPLQKIQDEVELYDNWAVLSSSSDSLLRDNFAQITGTDFFMDKRVVPYAEKLLEQTGAKVVSSSNVSFVLEVSQNQLQWLKSNSWRYGFIYRELQSDWRYVGVFPAEQMFYSGVDIESYLQIVLSGQE